MPKSYKNELKNYWISIQIMEMKVRSLCSKLFSFLKIFSSSKIGSHRQIMILRMNTATIMSLKMRNQNWMMSPEAKGLEISEVNRSRFLLLRRGINKNLKLILQRYRQYQESRKRVLYRRREGGNLIRESRV